MKKIIVYDVDGTLANNNHRNHWVATKPKNWKAFFAAQDQDVPYEDIVWTLRQHFDGGHEVLLATGRGEEYRDVTVNWFVTHNIPFHGLYMRPAKDNRADDIIKIELLQKIRADYAPHDVFLWYDDRNRVVDALRQNGVRVLHVAPGDF